jgi:predicted phosphohydrolase
MHRIENSIPNLYILNRYSVLIGDLCIAGATLWSNPHCQVPPFIVRIHGIRTREYKNKHKQDLKYLKSMIKYCQNEGLRLLIVTHHPPTRKVLDNNSKLSKFDFLYVNDLDYLIDKNNVDTWVCGHVHKNFDFISKRGCRVVGNQKGKKKDCIKDYSKKFVITL